MRFLQLTIPLLVALVCGLLGAGINFVSHPDASWLKEQLASWSRIIWGFAYLLGIYSLVRLHASRMRRREAGWGYSIFFFVGFLGMSFAALYNQGHWFWQNTVRGAQYQWLFENMFEAAGATMFSVLGFFIASAAYRTFRAKTAQAAILLSVAIIVMIGRVPLGEHISPYIPEMTEWIMKVPNTAAKRAVMFGVCLGMLATSLKIIFGIERTYLGGGD